MVLVSGVPTGGSLCVQLANIAVFSKLRKAVYSDSVLMKNVKAVKRYIDDGAGFYNGSTSDFTNWLILVNQRLNAYGLTIDESCIEPPGSYVPFLDIQFCFSSSGHLQTDLYTKPTDSRAYLNFFSAHPNHIFSGIVFSQLLRLRRIINDEDRLKLRVDEMKACFRNAHYPATMIDNIAERVLGMDRSLERKQPPDDNNTIGTPISIRVVSVYDSDDDLVKSVKQFEPILNRTRSFSLTEPFISPTASAPVSRAQSPAPALNTRTRSLSLSDSRTVSPAPTSGKRKLFKFVKTVGASIRSRLVRVKDLALGQRYCKTRACRSRNCMCCAMITDRESFRYNNMNVKSGGGSCASYNIVYLVVCSICLKHYVGRSTRCLRTRIGEHRRFIYQIVDNKPFQFDNDDYALGAHLYNHGYRDKSDFSKYFKVCVLEVCSPKILDVKEHKYIHKLNSLCPNGVNISNPFSIPMLHRNL